MRKAFERKSMRLLLVLVAVFALATTVVAQQQNDQKHANSALVRLLQSKGILTDEEAATIGQAATPAESEQKLAKLLLFKGLITREDYNQTVGASAVPVVTEGATEVRVVPAVLRETVNVGASLPANPGAAAAANPPEAPKVIPGIAPIRVFPVDPPKREGLIPDLKVGPVRLKPYGFIKVSAIWDSTSPEGNDFPLPMFRAGDTGPDAAPEFHVKARFARFGSNFEWVDPSPKMTITGRLEMDFEGNFSRATNRNFSTIRSNALQIRLAYGRVDYAVTDHTSIHALFGQDWTPFASSTLPSLFETTGLGLGYGTLYERAPQIRGGFTHNFGGSRNFKIQPEVAVVLPAYGNPPANVLTANITTTGAVTGLVGVENELAFGERQGVDSARPEVQGRIALQFQLDKAPGVPPAQIIVSGMQGAREAIVARGVVAAALGVIGGVPCTNGAFVTSCPAGTNTFRDAFPRGVTVSSSRYGYTGEIQLPTRYATIIAKYWNGEDLRFYFGGNFASTFNDTAGLFRTTNGVSVDGSSTVVFGCTDSTCATAAVAPQRPVRAQGGFVNVGFPLGRIFNANPEGRNAGWQLYLHYGIDEPKTRDIRRTAIRTNKSDLAAATLLYKLNNWVTFAFEQSMYRGRIWPGAPGAFFRGNPAREARDLRSEFGTIFTF